MLLTHATRIEWEAKIIFILPIGKMFIREHILNVCKGAVGKIQELEFKCNLSASEWNALWEYLFRVDTGAWNATLFVTAQVFAIVYHLPCNL